MTDISFHLYFDVLQTLERLQVPYVIIGAFAGTSYGITRITLDVDMVVDLSEDHIQALAAAYPSPRFYADPGQMRTCIQTGSLFNIIDTSEARKVDLIPLTMKPGYHFALQHRVRRQIKPRQGPEFAAWFAKPEDVIVGKLMAWDEGGAHKHEVDIRDMLTSVKLGDDPDLSTAFDIGYIDDWADQLGSNVKVFWETLRQVVETDEE